jgi:hypothetical protein
MPLDAGLVDDSLPDAVPAQREFRLCVRSATAAGVIDRVGGGRRRQPGVSSVRLECCAGTVLDRIPAWARAAR